MARIAGVNIPQNKLVHTGLTYIFGIGDKFSYQICKDLESYSKFIKGIKLLSVYGGTNIETQIKSLANSREYIAGEDFSRASGKLSELEIELQSLAGRVAYIKSNL